MGKTEIIAEPGTQSIDVTREFAAPRDLVYRAYTEPDLLVKWLGGRRHTMEIDTYEVRDGGRWRYVHTADGVDYAFHGVFHGTPSLDQGITQTFEFEGWPGQVSLETVTFEDRAGTSAVRIHSVYQLVEARDAMIESGMEDGMNDGFGAVDALLASKMADD
jgi:uncharacterized protein YndB with AHSA1/START domain